MTDEVPDANIMDHIPLVNIMPFGMCMSPANPMVAAATAAAMGVLTPMPCIPATASPWVPGIATVMLGNMPTLDNASTLMCMWGGVITFVTPGEFTVMVSNEPGSASEAGGGGAAGAGGAAAGARPPLGPVPPSVANQVFSVLAAQPDIAFKFPVDGCYARAHLMAQRMQKMGLAPGKAWTFATDPADPLWVNTPNHPDGKVEWGYHVAPTLPVKGDDGVVRDMVMDPSMFDHPVTVQEWKDAQHDHPHVVQTAIGDPPIPARGGSGYWPAADPPEGADNNAHDTMEEYKRYEGTRGWGR
jgi:hypothetical protein